MPANFPRALLLALALACSGPAPIPPTDAGTPDSGVPSQRHCVASSCDVSGNWQVIFTTVGPRPPLPCQAPLEKQLRFTSDLGKLCMLDAVDGGSDGGCGFSFVERSSHDAGFDYVDTWDLFRLDAGHIYGTWTTQASGVTSCSGSYSVHAVQ